MKRHVHYKARKKTGMVMVSDFKGEHFMNELLVILPTSVALIFVHCNY
jgi:hypothetical protein